MILVRVFQLAAALTGKECVKAGYMDKLDDASCCGIRWKLRWVIPSVKHTSPSPSLLPFSARSYFVLKGQFLYRYSKPDSSQPKGVSE